MFRCEVCPYFFRINGDYGYQDIKVFADVEAPDGWCVQKNKGVEIIDAPCSNPDFEDEDLAPLHDTIESQTLINSLIRGNLSGLWDNPPELLRGNCPTNEERLEENKRRGSAFDGVDLGLMMKKIISE